MAPKEAGETVTTTPTLYWFVSQPVNDPVELTIAQDGVAVPLLDVTLAPPARAGIYAFSLAREHVELKRGVEYRWSVALIANSAQPAKDIVASGDIICVDPQDGLQKLLADAPVASRPAIFARASLWYDALAALSAEVDAAPRAKALRAQRAALLDQVGLSEAAAFDRAM